MSLLVLAALGAGLSAETAAQVQVPTTPVFEYAAKFVCGNNGTNRPLTMGSYATAVNVHYPGDPQQFRPHQFRWKLAIAPPGGMGGVITKFETVSLKNDQAADFDCDLIDKVLVKNVGSTLHPMKTGFLVIQSSRELDVVAVYTSGPRNQGGQTTGIHTERVPARRVSVSAIIEPEPPISK
jgi:hypothetical protein